MVLLRHPRPLHHFLYAIYAFSKEKQIFYSSTPPSTTLACSYNFSKLNTISLPPSSHSKEEPAQYFRFRVLFRISPRQKYRETLTIYTYTPAYTRKWRKLFNYLPSFTTISMSNLVLNAKVKIKLSLFFYWSAATTAAEPPSLSFVSKGTQYANSS